MDTGPQRAVLQKMSQVYVWQTILLLTGVSFIIIQSYWLVRRELDFMICLCIER